MASKSLSFALPETTFRRVAVDAAVKLHRNAAVDGSDILSVPGDALTALAGEAFKSVAFHLRRGHNQQISSIVADIEASPADRMVAHTLMRNAATSAAGCVLPICQDTGTAVVMGWKGHRVWVEGDEDDAEPIARGIRDAYADNALRYSIIVPKRGLYDEQNSGNNLPADISLHCVKGSAYEFVFQAKGGGSANKTQLFQETKSTLREGVLFPFLLSKMRALGPAACPPYHVVFCIGGSPDVCLTAAKLGTMHVLDSLSGTPDGRGTAFRDREMEQALLVASRDISTGAQFGGKAMVLDVLVVRLPREGVWLEELDESPAVPELLTDGSGSASDVHALDLEMPMDSICDQLSSLPLGARLSLSGPVLVARDMAHAKWSSGSSPTPLLKRHPVFYAGPAKTPDPSMPSGSIGPTTSTRMDAYVPALQARGGSRVMIGKGRRSAAVVESCRQHGSFYLATIGGVAALFAAEHIVSQEVVEFPELGMEAVRMLVVKDMPCIMAVDDKGGDFYGIHE